MKDHIQNNDPDALHKSYIVDATRTPFVYDGGGFARTSPFELSMRLSQLLLLRNRLKFECIDELFISTTHPEPSSEWHARKMELLRPKKGLSPIFIRKSCLGSLTALSLQTRMIRSGDSMAGIVMGVDQTTIGQTNSIPDFKSAIRKISPLKTRVDSPGQVKVGTTLTNHSDLQNFYRSSAIKAKSANASGRIRQQISTIWPHDSMDHIDADEHLSHATPPLHLGGDAVRVVQGAAAILIANGPFCQMHNLKPLGCLEQDKFVGADTSTSSQSSSLTALREILEARNLSPADLDLYETHEKSATAMSQILEELQDLDQAQEKQSLPKGAKESISDKINVSGGSLAIGHSRESTGLRLVMSLLGNLQHLRKSRGMVLMESLEGDGSAVLLSRLSH